MERLFEYIFNSATTNLGSVNTNITNELDKPMDGSSEIGDWNQVHESIKSFDEIYLLREN